MTQEATMSSGDHHLENLTRQQGRTYPDFLDDMGKLLQAAMPRTDRERDELYAAEAEVRRLRSQLAVAEERQSLARERYDRERAVLREMFETWKSEVMSMPEHEPTDNLTSTVGVKDGAG